MRIYHGGYRPVEVLEIRPTFAVEFGICEKGAASSSAHAITEVIFYLIDVMNAEK
jgi:hypothetical protein